MLTAQPAFVIYLTRLQRLGSAGTMAQACRRVLIAVGMIAMDRPAARRMRPA